MSNTHTESHSTISACTLATDDLLRILNQFPSSVLPVGVMRELQSRGDEIHDSLVALIGRAIDAADAMGDGPRSESHDIFFAFALLVPLAKIEDRSLIESLLTLPEDTIDDLIGQLDIEATPYFIANFFEGQNAAELIDWIDRISEHPRLNSLNSVALYRAMTIAVARGHLDRATAIDALVNCLKKRSDKRNDLQSAIVILELMELQAHDIEAVDAVVRASFVREQIDDDYVGLDSWDDDEMCFEVRGNEARWSDPAAELRKWCYEFVSDDLEPVNATFRTNELANRSSCLSAESIPSLIDELRHSSYEQFPRDAVQSLDRAYADAYEAIIDLMREELARYQLDSTSCSGNGAYLGLALTIANRMPLPTDLLDAILQMPENDREQVFGDQFGLIVQAVALTRRYQYEFVEQWIWDADRSDADRHEMVSFYLFACRDRLLDRKETISTLVDGLRRAMLEDSVLIAPFAETLAFLSAKEHSQLLDEAFERDDTDWFFPLDDLRSMAQDAEFAKEQFRELSLSYRNVTTIIEGGVMFDGSLLEEKPRTITRLSPPVQPQSTWPQADVILSKTIRNDVRTGRNDPCPCGSGKKYKKCCLNK